jgi:hypothetical protein
VGSNPVIDIICCFFPEILFCYFMSAKHLFQFSDNYSFQHLALDNSWQTKTKVGNGRDGKTSEMNQGKLNITISINNS